MYKNKLILLAYVKSQITIYHFSILFKEKSAEIAKKDEKNIPDKCKKYMYKLYELHELCHDIVNGVSYEFL